MSINANYLIPSTDINTIVSLAIEAYDQKNPEFLEAALEHLDQYPLTEKQNNKIVTILKNVFSDNTKQISSLIRTQIIQILDEETEKPSINYTDFIEEKNNDVLIFTNTLGQITNTLCKDIIQCLFIQCISQDDIQCIGALSGVNKHYNQAITSCWQNFSLKQVCPQGLTILDLKAMGLPGDEPKVNHMEVLKAFYEIAPCLEDNAGCTLLTLPKGLTVNQLMQIGKEAGITMAARPGCLEEHGDIEVEQVYVVLITNSVFMKSRNKCTDAHNALVIEHKCELPTLQEYITLCVFTNKIFKKSLYGQSPWTYGRSSTCLKGDAFVVGASSLERLSFNNPSDSDHRFNKEDCGAGGRRKF
jgi:hypothetical protein